MLKQVIIAGIALAAGCSDGVMLKPAPDGGAIEIDSSVEDAAVAEIDVGPKPDSGVEMPDAGVEPPDGGDASFPDAEPEPEPIDLGEGDGSDVVTIGDSYMRLPNLVQQPGNEGVELSLERAGGRTYRKYGFTGGTVFPPTAIAVLNGVIPMQFTRAMLENPNILTVVATGGGNDLTDECNGPTAIADLSDACRALLDQIDGAIEQMIADMAAAGVLDVVWVGYGDTATTGQRVFAGALDYLRERRIERCAADDPALLIRCHYVDNKAHPGLVTRDGFHPDPAGYDLIGVAVWDRMQAERVRR